jgi:MYXO-CTERM domain-containing protein
MTATDRPTATATPTPTSGGAPGFGPFVAAVALLTLATALVRRR